MYICMCVDFHWASQGLVGRRVPRKSSRPARRDGRPAQPAVLFAFLHWSVLCCVCWQLWTLGGHLCVDGVHVLGSHAGMGPCRSGMRTGVRTPTPVTPMVRLYAPRDAGVQAPNCPRGSRMPGETLGVLTSTQIQARAYT
jgi:hypothetical protein